MIRSFLAMWVLLIVGIGCAPKPNLYTSDEVMQEFNPVYLEFDNLTARGRIVIEEPSGKTTRGTINIRAKKDSILWFSITPGLGLEAFRGTITKDRVMIKDRLNGQDINLTFQEVETIYDLSLSLDLLQNIIFANIPHEFSYRDRLIRVGQYFELTQAREGFRYHSRVSTQHGKVAELTSTSMKEKGSLMANYHVFEDLENQPFPNQMLLRLSFNTPDGPQASIVNLEMSRTELVSSPLSFPFRF
ncbi:hypothetical protein A33Q_2043 [Indibacter alkaliphilus LW1]|jgi:hypothetical protein|uniref:DUF4292 domain-containing protein n=1 Tax=Indibacter alkaliphilus (strain CCUG 57479 / KCTC 22604 / LW1) TaxID=1189612 RepID=S2E3H4_INDAL|nr:DUF4292 domain-containing protein [Indibacter alkaliphilus]EOZ96733.1 hypothetical protein A33Q_2043 [Indibacter alkaliphilus LW1]